MADVFDALVTDRPYRKKYSPEETIEILRSESGKALDPELVDIFLALISAADIPTLLEQANAAHPGES